MRFEFVRGVCVGVHTSRAPSSAAWLAHCDNIRALQEPLRAVLIYTAGGGPDSGQRQALRTAMLGRPVPPTAIVTGSAVARGIITSLNWFRRDNHIACFAPDAFDEALRYLGCGQGSLVHREVVAVFTRIARELGVRLPMHCMPRPHVGP